MGKAILQQFIEGGEFGERLLVEGVEVFRFMHPGRFTASPFDYAQMLLDALGDKVKLYLSADPDRGQERDKFLDTWIRQTMKDEYEELTRLRLLQSENKPLTPQIFEHIQDLAGRAHLWAGDPHLNI